MKASFIHMAAFMEYALRIQNLSHAYTESPIVEDIALAVRAGEFVSIVGPSGCGKSTLLKLAGKLLTPTTGTVDVTLEQSMVFQSAQLLPWRTARENILLPADLHGTDSATAHADAERLLDDVKLPGFGDFYPHELSGGMQQRVAIARAFAVRPKLLLMDEPFGALDELTREEMNRVLLRARARSGGEARAAVLFVTHSITEAVFLSDRVVVLSPRPGRIKDVVDIPLPRPRSAETLYTDEFNHLVQCVRKSLRS